MKNNRMRSRVLAIAIVLGVIAGRASRAGAADDPISGEWDVTFHVQGMTTPATFKLSLAGDRVTGTAVSHHTGACTLRDGSWKDGRLAFTLDFGSHESIEVTGGLKDGGLSGEFRTEGSVGQWEARRGEPGTHAHSGAPESPARPNPYAPYEPLISDWDVASEGGGPAVAGTLFRWGPNHSYIWFAGSLLIKGTAQPHFEGMLMWNGSHKNLDMLVVMDLKNGLAQEHGTFSVAPDGTLVRDIEAVFSEGVQPLGLPVAGPEGEIVHFRQTFLPVGPDKVLTKVMRQSGEGWVATFPGSDHLVMTRHAKG